jgi:YD repeat-containing protein
VLSTCGRPVKSSYDALQRLVGAVESPGSSFAYSYDPAGNRTGVSVNGTATASYSYDAADQVVGWGYDAAGNLLSDGATSYTYDALNHLTGSSATGRDSSYAYNGDGTLVSQTTNGTTTSYAQDLAASQSQILATTGITSTNYLYGSDIAPLLALSGSTHAWYGLDGQGSVRQTLDDAANVLGIQTYDPYGQVAVCVLGACEAVGGSGGTDVGYCAIRGAVQDLLVEQDLFKSEGALSCLSYQDTTGAAQQYMRHRNSRSGRIATNGDRRWLRALSCGV